jgi:hypothetical protein
VEVLTVAAASTTQWTLRDSHLRFTCTGTQNGFDRTHEISVLLLALASLNSMYEISTE